MNFTDLSSEKEFSNVSCLFTLSAILDLSFLVQWTNLWQSDIFGKSEKCCV